MPIYDLNPNLNIRFGSESLRFHSRVFPGSLRSAGKFSQSRFSFSPDHGRGRGSLVVVLSETGDPVDHAAPASWTWFKEDPGTGCRLSEGAGNESTAPEVVTHVSG